MQTDGQPLSRNHFIKRRLTRRRDHEMTIRKNMSQAKSVVRRARYELLSIIPRLHDTTG